MADTRPVGFIGVGRLGLPLALRLLAAGKPVVTGSRGRAEELVAAGGSIAGDGSVRAVSEAADVVFSCMPSEAALVDAVEGDEGILAADGPAPLLIETSTLPLPLKERLRERLVEAGGEMLDAPVSGTPKMAEIGIAVVYASGPQERFEAVADLIEAISPNMKYAGEFGAGTHVKYIAQVLATIHVTAAAEAMALASLAGLDLDRVATILSESPGATSGQFSVRAPLIAAGEFEGKLVTVDMTIKDLDQIAAYAAEVGSEAPLLTVVKRLFDEMVAAGYGDRDPGVLAQVLRDRAVGPDA